MDVFAGGVVESDPLFSVGSRSYISQRGLTRADIYENN